LNATAVALLKLAPVTVTSVPAGPLIGLNPVILGATAKATVLVAIPAGVVTAIGPVIAFAGTLVVIWVEEFTTKAAGAPLKVTAVAPAKFAPDSVTAAPTAPLPGEKLAMRGATRKLVALVATLSGVVTVIGPEVAPTGTLAAIVVGAFTVNVAASPLNWTAVAPVRAVPAIVTFAPGAPLLGVNPLIVEP
jgi:hypothetical protein